MKKTWKDALEFCLDNMRDLEDKDWKDHGLRLADYEKAKKWVRDVEAENTKLRDEVAELKAVVERQEWEKNVSYAGNGTSGVMYSIGEGWKYKLGDVVTKVSGSCWTGKVVGFYSTELTPVGYAVESSTEKGSVQIYPEKALVLKC